MSGGKAFLVVAGIVGAIWFFNSMGDSRGSSGASDAPVDRERQCGDTLDRLIDNQHLDKGFDDNLIDNLSRSCSTEYDVWVDYMSIKGFSDQGAGGSCADLDNYNISEQAKRHAARDGLCSTGGGHAESGASDLASGAISWTEASGYVGSVVTFCGPVVDSYTAFESEGQPTFLNVGANYPDYSGVTVIIWGDNAGNFPRQPARLYSGETICVNGEVANYEGYTQVEVTGPRESKFNEISLRSPRQPTHDDSP